MTKLYDARAAQLLDTLDDEWRSLADLRRVLKWGIGGKPLSPGGFAVALFRAAALLGDRIETQGAAVGRPRLLRRRQAPKSSRAATAQAEQASS